MKGLVEVIHTLEGLFDGCQARRSYGGAIAYNYYGPPRFTQDVVVLVLASALHLPALVKSLADAGCHREGARGVPLPLPSVLEDLRGKGHLTSFFMYEIRVEWFAPWHPFHQRVLERSPERDLEGRLIRIHAPEDLIVFKKIFDRPKDLMDIKAMLLSQKGHLDLERIRAEATGLLADDQLKELNELIQEYGR